MVESKAEWLHLREDHTLCVVDQYGGFRVLPFVADRPLIVKGFYIASGCPGGDRLYEAVRRDHVWHGLKQDCLDMTR